MQSQKKGYYFQNHRCACILFGVTAGGIHQLLEGSNERNKKFRKQVVWSIVETTSIEKENMMSQR